MSQSALPIPSSAEAGVKPNKRPVADDFTFRADDPVMLEMDLFQLDCIVDRLKGADLSTHRSTLRRIHSNLNDLMENTHGHAH